MCFRPLQLQTVVDLYSRRCRFSGSFLAHGNRLILLPALAATAANALRVARFAAGSRERLSLRFGRGEEVISHRRAVRAQESGAPLILHRSAIPATRQVLRQPFRQSVLVLGSQRPEPGLDGGSPICESGGGAQGTTALRRPAGVAAGPE